MPTAENFSKCFPGTPPPAVDDLDLALAPGELFALLGPNRPGKTTALNGLLGLLPEAGLQTAARSPRVSGCSKGLREKAGVMRHGSVGPTDLEELYLETMAG